MDVAVDRPGGEDLPLPAEDLRARPDLEQRMDAVGDIGVAGLAERDDPPVAHADVAFHDTGVVEDDGVCDHEVRGTLGTSRHALVHRLADRLAATEDRLVAAAAAILFDFDPEIGVGQPDRVADGRAVQRCVAVP